VSHTSNPIATAVRSWVLRSPGRLALGVLIAVVSLFALRGVIVVATNGTDSSDIAAADATSSTTATPVPSAVEEVTESDVLALSSTAVIGTPARAAMFYAHTFLDPTASDTQWTLRLATVTDAANVTDRIAAARPNAPVTILGPTRTTTAAGTAGTRVEIDTSAGTLTATLTQHTTDTSAIGVEGGWQLASPLPTLDLSALPTATAPITPTTTRGPAATTTAPTAAPTPPSGTAAPTSPTTSTPAVQAPVPTAVPAPVPVPGPIPIPDLDTPLPGARQ
jgi:hypothetical protein